MKRKKSLAADDDLDGDQIEEAPLKSDSCEPLQSSELECIYPLIE